MILDKSQEDLYVVMLHNKYTRPDGSGFAYVDRLEQAYTWKSKHNAKMWADMQRQGEEHTQVCKMTVARTVFDNGEW